MKTAGIIYFGILSIMLLIATPGQAIGNHPDNGLNSEKQATHYRKVKVDGVHIFYREAGPVNAPVVLLMHGYPTSSFMFRNLIPLLSDKYHVIAPDLPGFGFSDFPSEKDYAYTFDHYAQTMQAFIDKLGLKRFAIYIFDYGAPVGLRLAMRNPDRITGIITQDGNAYVEGLLDWSHGLVKAYWDNPTPENRNALKKFFTLSGTRFQYLHGASDSTLIAPENIYLDQTLMDRPGNLSVQLNLIGDYKNNVKMYPQFQAYIKKYQPKMLVLWGVNDPYFSPKGAWAFKRDNPKAIVKLYNTGHFALETNTYEIGQEIKKFLPTL